MKEPDFHVKWDEQKDALLSRAPINMQAAIDELDSLLIRAEQEESDDWSVEGLEDLVPVPSQAQRKNQAKAWQAIVQFLNAKKSKGEDLIVTTGQEWMGLLDEFHTNIILQGAMSDQEVSLPENLYGDAVAELEKVLSEQKARSFFLALSHDEQEEISASVLRALRETMEEVERKETEGLSPYEIVEHEQEKDEEREATTDAVMRFQRYTNDILEESGYGDTDKFPVGAEVFTDFAYEVSDRLRKLFRLKTS